VHHLGGEESYFLLGKLISKTDNLGYFIDFRRLTTKTKVVSISGNNTVHHQQKSGLRLGCVTATKIIN